MFEGGKKGSWQAAQGGNKEERICTTDDVQRQKPKNGCIAAFLAILTAVLKKPQNVGFIFTWKLNPRMDLGKIGCQKGIKTEER